MAAAGEHKRLPSVLTDEQLASAQLQPRKRPWTWVAAAVVVIVLAEALYSVVTNPGFGWPVVGDFFFSPQVIAGLFMTMMLTAVSMTLALLLGTVIAVAAASRNPVLSVVAKAYIWIFRAIPLLVQIIFWYNLAALYPRLSFGIPFMPPLAEVDTNSVITAISAAIIAMSLNEGAYMAEIVRSGLNSVDSGQREAARALGMSSWDSFRRIVMPQVLRYALPGIGNVWQLSLKDSALISVTGLAELMRTSQVAAGSTRQYFLFFIVGGALYLVLTSLSDRVFNRAERRANRSMPSAMGQV